MLTDSSGDKNHPTDIARSCRNSSAFQDSRYFHDIDGPHLIRPRRRDGHFFSSTAPLVLLVFYTLLSLLFFRVHGGANQAFHPDRSSRREREEIGGGDRPWLFRGSRDDLRMITIHKHFEITRLRGMRPYRGLKLFLSVGVCRPGEVRVDTNLDPEMLTEVAVHG